MDEVIGNDSARSDATGDQTTPSARRYAASAAPLPPRLPSLDDPHEPARKAIAYRLIWLLIGIIGGSGAMLFVLLIFKIDDSVEIILRWMGFVLSPVAALAGSAVTFYMERPPRRD